MALIMMYKTQIKPDKLEEMDELRGAFMDIYEKHDVDVIGHWRESKTPHISYYMARYDDEDDYTKTVLKLHEDHQYRELTARLNEIRTDFEATRLTPV
ncbi:hypothetical protein EU537_00060 [Candidatus Thorarchaeota archaeon]|nr:MAG: hypothetical protein EU537_00060 [Candidatus Thorarchaeota archaeon]